MVVGACPKHCIYTCLIVSMDDELGKGIMSIILTHSCMVWMISAAIIDTIYLHLIYILFISR